MKFFVSTLLIVVLAFISGLFLPWWGFAMMAFVVALFVHQRPGKAFLSGFLALFILWGGMAWWIDRVNEGVLSSKIAMILPLNGNQVLLILTTAVTGALVAGFAAMTGSYLRSIKR